MSNHYQEQAANNRRILGPLGLVTPRGVERDPEFRDDICRRSRVGMFASGVLGMTGPLALLMAHAFLVKWRMIAALDDSVRTMAYWVPLAAVGITLSLVVLGRTRWGPRHGRLLVALAVLGLTVVVPLDSIAAGAHHPSKFGLLAVFMLIAVGTMPYRAWHTIMLGVGITIAYALTALIVPGMYGNNPLNLIPELPIFMVILTIICAGISGLMYQARYRQFMARQGETVLREQITASEEKYRSLFENSADGIYVYSEDVGGFVMVNHVVEDILGVPAAQLATMHFTEIIHPDDREMVERYHEARIRGEDAPNHYVIKLVKRGSPDPVICGLTIHHSDDPRITTGSLRDITARVKMEEELTHLAELPESNPFPVLRYDYDGKVTYLNAAARRFPVEIGHPELSIFEILPDDLEARIKKLIDTNTTILDSRHDQTGHTFSITYRPLPESRQIFIWMVDMTERIKSEERVRAHATELEETNRELREAQAQLVQSEKMAALGNLVAGVAHEINTPVGSIHANADVARRAIAIIQAAHGEGSCTFEPEVEAKFARAVAILEESNVTTRTATERIVGIVRSLRNFARLDEAELKAVDLHEGIESTLTLVHHELKNRIEVVRDYGDLPQVQCFPNQINQVYMNILVNAIHAIDGRGTITITTRAQAATVTVQIADTGRGISEDHLASVFDPGFTTKGVGVGTGLGLSIVYKIMEAHAGSVDVSSVEGKGTSFLLTLPVSPHTDAATRYER